MCLCSEWHQMFWLTNKKTSTQYLPVGDHVCLHLWNCCPQVLLTRKPNFGLLMLCEVLDIGGPDAMELYSIVLERRASICVTRSLVCMQGWSWLVATAGRCCWVVRDCISQEGDQAILTCVKINVGGASLEQLYHSSNNLWFFQWLKLYCIQNGQKWCAKCMFQLQEAPATAIPLCSLLYALA